MLSTGIANPAQLKVLTEALDAYCLDHAIEPGSIAYEDAGRLLISIFSRGETCTCEALKLAMGRGHVGKA